MDDTDFEEWTAVYVWAGHYELWEAIMYTPEQGYGETPHHWFLPHYMDLIFV